MDPEPLSALLKAGEGLYIEFKADEQVHVAKSKGSAKKDLEAERKRLCKEVAAFSNTAGGLLLYGVEDDGTVSGLSDPQKSPSRVEAWISAHIEPTPAYNPALLQVGDRQILVLDVHAGEHTLYVTDGRVYLREGSISRPAKPKEIEGKVLRWDLIAKVEELSKRPTTGEGIAAGFQGQGNLSTMDYFTLRDRLMRDFPILTFKQ